ncbi:helix-turn-helix domain-containing protein [Alkaliphilus peptidifermentans]|uniref:HTH cro/C1-type domain-containing protein n=1 Tax=Alkaliphilus peptidifermentans DSM 18978 TaxID=1120976 RepID=A0A1G5JIC8_9FIRM|nr:helix-turn-helix transcriptional regulator [Alkaliphilus peptidifermentans]SCY87641.1 hypothetical protein SAMN03080606_02860 [Alkaliphilus peptidifermentans DSM 18978]
MAKVNVTKELAEKIKELRLKNKVKAIDLAEHIKKSPAFISRLENADIKTIDYEELINIFKLISKGEDLEKLLDRFSLETDVELDKQIWYLNFDTVERKIPVPPELIDYINTKITDLDLTIPYIVDYINRNEDLRDLIEDHNIVISKYENNLWHLHTTEDGKSTHFIVMKLSLSEIKGLLEKKIDTTNYVTIQSIIYNLLRLEYELNDKLSDEVNEKIKDNAVATLNSYKFYSSLEKIKLLKNASTENEINSLLSEFDINNRELVNDLLNHISFLSDWNVKYTNEKMKLINKNFEWDSSYTLTLASLPFYELNNISKSLKGDLLENIKKLIEEYKNKPETEKTFETY